MISKNVHFGGIHILGDSRNYTKSYQDCSRGAWDVVCESKSNRKMLKLEVHRKQGSPKFKCVGMSPGLSRCRF